jgi:hypothetical protein
VPSQLREFAKINPYLITIFATGQFESMAMIIPSQAPISSLSAPGKKLCCSEKSQKESFLFPK